MRCSSGSGRYGVEAGGRMSAQPIRGAEAPPAPRGLYAKLHAIMSECGYIQKDGENKDQNYKYVSDKAIKEKLQTLMVKHKLLFVQKSATVTDLKTGLGKYANQVIFVTRLAYSFVDIETGESLDGECDGAGSDWLDKGIYKAITGASKYALRNTFMIPTGDDPEQDVEDKRSKAEEKAAARAEQKRIAEEKIVSIRQEIAQLNPEEQKLVDELGTEKPKMIAQLQAQRNELAKRIGTTEALQTSVHMLERFGVVKLDGLQIPQLRELAVLLHREIAKARVNSETGRN
jgi:hypothetical protein